MKKYFSFFCAAAMTCCAIVSCNKENSGNGGDNHGNGGNGGDKPTEVNISIDGDFSDWDAITETSPDGTAYFCAQGAEGYTGIRNLKATSDADCIYMCFEVSTSKIPMKEGGHHGDSWDGMGFPTPAPLWIYIDSDNNPATGLKPHWVGDVDLGGLAFDEFQFDNGLNLYTWIATETGLWDMGWQQANVKLQSELTPDGFTIDSNEFYNIKTDDYPDGFGWNHEKDNTIITFENFKTKVNGAWSICELAIDRTLLVDNEAKEGPQMTEIAFGVANQCSDTDGKGGWSGIIPGDRKPAVLKLINQ